MARYDVASIGEGQIRLTTLRAESMLSARQLYLSAAGSEANVTGLLSQLGHVCAWASVVPEGQLGDRIVREYRAVGLDVDHVVRPSSGRVALYFLQSAEYPLPAEVVYDRQHTPFRDVSPSMFDWERLLDAQILFVTGITLALTDSTRSLIGYAVELAKKRGVKIVLDVNYRSKLWSETKARETLLPLLDYLDVLFCSEQDGARVFGIEGGADRVAEVLRAQHRLPVVVSTAGRRGVYLSARSQGKFYPAQVVRVVDRPGAGDAFIGGFLHGYLQNDLDMGVRTGLKAAQYALSHHGDLVQINSKEFCWEDSDNILR